MVRSLALFALASAAAVAAQSTTVNLFMPLYDEQDMVASIVAVDSDKTTFLVECPKSADPRDCGVADGGQTVIYGPSTFSLNYAYDGRDEGTYTEDINCKLNPGKDVATCSISVSQAWDNTAFDSNTVISTSGYLDLLMPVTVTAGAALITDSAGSSGSSETTAAAPASTAGSDSATATATGSASSKSTGFSSVSSASKSSSDSSSAESADSTASSSSGSAATTPTASNNAAGAMVTQNAVLAGAAVLIGGAMLL